MNLYLHDIETFTIRAGDTLRNPRLREQDGALQRFDAVIANPPFALKKWGHEAWAGDPFGRSDLGVPPAGSGDFAFIEHMVASMTPKTGRMAVVMPHSVLFKTGDEGTIRRNLLNTGWLEAVVALPRNLFYSTTIAACVLVLRRDADARENGVLFIDASKQFVKTRNKNEMDVEHIDAVVSAYRDQASEAAKTRLVPFEEIEGHDFNLSLGRYIAEARDDEVEAVSALEACAELRESLRAVETEMVSKLQEAGLVS